MKQSLRYRYILTAVVFFILLAALAMAEDNVAAGPKAEKTDGLQQRIDFSSAQILGQSIKSGAVYLMHRKQSDISSMLKVRKDYRKEIMEDFSLEHSALISDKVPTASGEVPEAMVDQTSDKAAQVVGQRTPISGRPVASAAKNAEKPKQRRKK
jgi:hypothetical protein